jgi:hypothetical protein
LETILFVVFQDQRFSQPKTQQKFNAQPINHPTASASCWMPGSEGLFLVDQR